VIELEKALRFELKKISELNNKIFPTNAPKDEKSPYLVYILNERPLKTLEGIKEDNTAEVLLNIFASSYEGMSTLRKKVKEIILTFPLSTIGEGDVHCKDLTIENITGTYESELNLYRGIIDIKLFYRGA
jgi:hypothetical protein